MKKITLILLALTICLSMCACSRNDASPTEAPTEPKIARDELLTIAVPLMQEEANKIFDNAAYAKSLISNTYTFTGKVFEIETDYIDIALRDVPNEAGELMGYDYWNLSFHLYLPTEELINVNHNDTISFVGQISDVQTKKTDDPYLGYSISGTVIIMENVFIAE